MYVLKQSMKSSNQSINQSINHSINQSIDQSINQSINCNTPERPIMVLPTSVSRHCCTVGLYRLWLCVSGFIACCCCVIPVPSWVVFYYSFVDHSSLIFIMSVIYRINKGWRAISIIRHQTWTRWYARRHRTSLHTAKNQSNCYSSKTNKQ